MATAPTRPAPTTVTSFRPEAPRRLRVLTVTPRFLPETGGVEEHVRQVTSRLAAAGLAVTVLTTDASGRLATHERRDRVEVRRVRAWPRWSDVRLAPQVYTAVARGRWDVVHVQSYHTFVAPLAMLAAARARIPYVLTFHAGGHSSRIRHRARPLQRMLLRPLLTRAARLVALTSSEVDGYVRELRINRDRFVVIPNGIEAPPEAPATVHGRLTGAARAASRGGVIISIGRLERYKGHHRLLRAMPQILARRPDAKLSIIGSGPYEADLHQLAASLGISDRVTIGAVPGRDRGEMANRIREADLVALLSDFETHPLSVLEAASLGRPVLVADSPGLRELAAAGVAQSVARDARPAVVAVAVLEQLEHPTPPRQLKLNTWDETATELSRLYDDVVRSSQCASSF
jgi:glycosyltransferase involved in cell wall biosynthesis